MSGEVLAALAIAMGLAAILYSSVGHGGASAYLAIMALAGIAPDTMRPVALTLNLVVSAIALATYARAGHFDWRLFLSVALPAMPLAYLGGQIDLPAEIYRSLVGAVLLVAAAQFAWKPHTAAPAAPRTPVLAGASAGLGLLAGLTGTGGGIFLSPLLLATGWAAARTTAAVSAGFIFVNSAAGLAGNLGAVGALPQGVGWLALAVALGGVIGSRLGARIVSRTVLMRLLAAVLFIAGLKLILT